MNSYYPLLSPTTMIISFVVVIAALVVLALMSKSGSQKRDAIVDDSVDDLLERYGEPDDLLLLDVTRSNDPVAVVLVYSDFIVVEGKRIERDTITDVTFNNAANPYMGTDYQLFIKTTIPNRPKIKLPIGSDPDHARDVTTRLAAILNK